MGSRNDTGSAVIFQAGSTVNTSGGAPGTGDVTLRAAVPDFTTAVVVDKSSGAVTSGSFTGGTLTNGFIEKQSGTALTMNGGTLTAGTNNRVDLLGVNNLGLGSGVVAVEGGSHGGSVNAGTISLKTLTTSGTGVGGGAGPITLIGQGGVQVGAISTKGAQGADVTIVGATPSTIGPVIINNGQLVGIFTGATPSIANGAGILVSGAINTAGTAGSGGKVFMDADSQVEITGAVTTSGLTTASALSSASGGTVSLRSRTSKVSVTGIINTSALSAKTALGAGKAGDIKIQAMSYINTGALKAIGANNTGTGAGGNGGKVDLLMEHITVNAVSQAFGAIKVSGIIDVHGGNGNSATSSTAASNGGDGGQPSTVRSAPRRLAVFRRKFKLRLPLPMAAVSPPAVPSRCPQLQPY